MQICADRLSFLKSALAFAGISIFTLAITAEAGNAADMLLNEPPITMAPDTGMCANQHVLSRASYHFSYQVHHVPHLPRVQIRSFTNITRTRYEPAVTRHNITRHYCTAMVNMNNGTVYPVAYVVAENQGFAGVAGINVDFCVDGFDRWRIYDNACRALR